MGIVDVVEKPNKLIFISYVIHNKKYIRIIKY
jgi:hypothetical protein